MIYHSGGMFIQPADLGVKSHIPTVRLKNCLLTCGKLRSFVRPAFRRGLESQSTRRAFAPAELFFVGDHEVYRLHDIAKNGIDRFPKPEHFPEPVFHLRPNRKPDNVSSIAFGQGDTDIHGRIRTRRLWSNGGFRKA